MYLKRLEICGFKSFADKTVLDFETGILGIVGPNGCGKSNIVDSVRWCLGEQRSKSMRSSSMQEVIFGGTQIRTTTGMAEVSLTFDNSQSVLPVNYSEITVTRRLFRSGESEYFINKTQCRYKDVRDMFLDTGVGFDSYSVIEQGKVDFLVTAKPENRRELFEEAAGVAKYKARREETLKKLEKINVDISRLSDTLAIHKQQITALDAAAKKAKQYEKYKEELTGYEVSSLVLSITRSSSEIEKLKKSLEPKIEEFESSNVLTAQLDAEIQETRLALDKRNEQYVDINKYLNEVKTRIGVAEQIMRHAAQREAEIKTEQTAFEQELSVNRDKTVQMEKQLDALNIDNSLAAEADSAEDIYREKQQQYDSIKAKLLEFESRKNSIHLKISEFESKKEKQLNFKAELAQAKIRLDADIASLQPIILRLENDIETANQEIAGIETELIAANESLQLLEIKQEKINKTILENEDKIKILNGSLSHLKEILTSSEARTATLKEFDRRDPVRSSIRAVLDLGNIARGPVSSLIEADEGKYELVAAALGEKLNYLVCETLEKAEYAVEFLEKNGLSRLSFIIVEKISDSHSGSSVTDSHLGYDGLIKYLKYNPEDKKIVRFICSDTFVSGSKVYGNAVIQGGGEISFEKPVLIEEQIKKLCEKSGEIKQSISNIQFEAEQINEYQKKSRFEKENLDLDAVKIKTQIEGKHARIEEKRNNIKNIDEEIGRHREEINHKRTEFAALDEKISVFETEFSDYEKEENKFYEELKTVENNMLSLRKEEEDIAPLMMEARSNWDKKTAELENKKKALQYIVDNIASVKEQTRSADIKIAENNKKLSELAESQESEAAKIRQLCEEQSQKESDLQVSLACKQTLQNTLDAKTNKWRDLRYKLDTLSSEINAVQIALKNFEYQKDDLLRKLAETYGKNYEEIKNDFNDTETKSEEIIKIKRKIESLGSVNLAAREEYEASEQRYNFLLAHQQDLLKAKDDLYEVIKKINRAAVEDFEKTFNIVKENFKKLYVKLFGGGEADLMLTDENNLLESGIDICAQPPGKKLRNISLCSGGEKALTAVALLFAFFMARPSPFCILDEVDASLDEANVDRYNAVIKEFSSKTQFLIVTHNKRTMEMADILYGVTMEEHGISKIISVKINKQDYATVQ